MNHLELKNTPSTEALPCYIGFAAVQFRNEAQDSVKYPNGAHSWYVLNGLGDGWFRCNDGYNAHGYGLAINSFKVTSKKSEIFGDGHIYKAKMEYTTHQEEPDSAMMWLFVHKNTTLEAVLEYIETNKDSWYP
jgi:hypothetical protein